MHWGVESYEPLNQKKVIKRVLGKEGVFIDVSSNNIGIFSTFVAAALGLKKFKYIL